MITELYQEKGKFNCAKVLSGITTKLIARHPHVFSKKNLKDKDEVLAYWIKHKAKQKKRKTVKDRLPMHAGSLLMAGIYFKEKGYVIEKFKPDQKSLFKRLNKEAKLLQNSRKKELALSHLLLTISEISYMYGVEPESLLRSEVLKQAQRIKY